MEATKQAIVSASRYPMSIILIGVGNYNFDNMRDLDSYKQLLTSGGVNATRDIVHFVEMRKFIDISTGAYNKQTLAKKVLKELPKQITKWKKLKGV